MSRFDAAAARLAAAWGFTESEHEYRERAWIGPQQGEQVRTQGGEREYLRVEHAGLYVTLNVPHQATAEQIIALLDLIAEMIGKRDEPAP